MRKPLNTIIALRVEELRLSKRQLQADLRAMGLKPHSVTTAQLTGEAKKRMDWFAHDAFRNILRMQLEDALHHAERKRSAQSADTSGKVLAHCAELKTCARNSEPAKSMASAVQMSRTLEAAK